MNEQTAVAVPVPFVWKPVSPTSKLHKHLPFAQKLPVFTHLLVQRALVMRTCNQEVKERAEGEFSGLDMRRSVLMALIDSL